MVNFEDTFSNLKEFLGETGKAAEDALMVQKIKFNISSKKSELNKLFAKLGVMAYKNAVDGAENADAAEEIISQITDKKQEISELEQKLALYKGYDTCSCGSVNKNGAKYCNSCGKEL